MIPSPETRSFAQVDLSAVRHNIEVVRRFVGPRRTIMAVVKANAYGHGMVPVARAALAAGAGALGVATADEALELRETEGFSGVPILVMAPSLGADAERLQAAGIAVAVGEAGLLDAHHRLAERRGLPAKLHVQVDTGIGRDGFRFDDLSWIDAASRQQLSLQGLFMHFAVADGTSGAENEFTNLQLSRFEAVIAKAAAAGLRPILHAANSGAILRHPGTHFDMVRPGIMMYGAEPADEPELCPDLRPVIALKSVIGSIRNMEPGDTVSYGRLYTVPDRRRIGVIPIGYGDGYPRQFSNRFSVLIRGRRAPIRGRVCMDQIMVDLAEIPDARIGDEVVLYGTQQGEQIRLEEAARVAGTISYELTCILTPRVPRLYTGE